jgi:hypothetical protein
MEYSIESLAGPKPRVLVIVPEQTTRVLLAAELMERGCEVVGAADVVAAALYLDSDLLLVDQQAVTRAGARFLDSVLPQHRRPTVLLLGSASLEAPKGPWHGVLRRPRTVGGIAEEVAQVAARSAAARG